MSRLVASTVSVVIACDCGPPTGAGRTRRGDRGSPQSWSGAFGRDKAGGGLGPHRRGKCPASFVDLDAGEVAPTKGADGGGGNAQAVAVECGGNLLVADGPGTKEKKGFAERSQGASTVQAEVQAPSVFEKKAVEEFRGIGH